MGETDAQTLENTVRWDHACLTISVDVAASVRAVGQGQGLCSSLRLPAQADALDALSALSQPVPSDRLWHHQRRLQNGFHAAVEAFRHGVDERGGGKSSWTCV